MFFGSVRFALFVKNLKKVRVLESYGSRYKILTENGNELCTVRFALFNEKSDNGMLFGAVRIAIFAENGVFLQRFGKRISLKNGTVFGYGAVVF